VRYKFEYSGFGLITTYVKSVSIATLTQVIIMLGFSIQLYFPLRGFWEKIGMTGIKFVQEGNLAHKTLPISVTNSLNDRIVSTQMYQSPLTEYIACFIALIVGYSGFIGRVGNL
jgi:hypothetical protein